MVKITATKHELLVDPLVNLKWIAEIWQKSLKKEAFEVYLVQFELGMLKNLNCQFMGEER